MNNIAENPKVEKLQELLKFYQNGQIKNAENLAIYITQNFPNHHFAWKVLGAIFGQTGRNLEAIDANQMAIKLSPNDVETYNNLGNSLRVVGKLDEAEKNYKKAISLKPDFSIAHSNLGVTFQDQMKFEDAYNSFINALELNPNLDLAKINFSHCVKNLRFNSSNPKLYPIFINIITSGNYTRPKDIAGSILSLINHEPLIKDLFYTNHFDIDQKKLFSIIKCLNQFPILYHLMLVCSLPDLNFEKLFTSIRKFVLYNLKDLDSSEELNQFLSILCIHCFINEFVYFVSDKEIQLLKELESKISHDISNSKQPTIVEILCFACYRYLYKFDWINKITIINQFKIVKTRLIDEPLFEQSISTKFDKLKDITNEISSKVRSQYEENPYPRWIKLGLPLNSQSVREISDEYNLNFHSNEIKNLDRPDILIAGCGTGQHSIETATRFKNSQILAIDLSLSSLSYAQRKTTELKIDNITYIQADILDLLKIEKKFDIIESIGVLHHMNNPLDGWKVLTKLLKTNGLMKIGLYSELARTDIVNIREEISKLNIGSSENEIRNYRQSLIESKTKYGQNLQRFEDFFSLSMLRDLIFHVQEHRFTIEKIQESLSLLGLHFCGFESKEIVNKFKLFYGENSDEFNLELWSNFEKENPNIFAGMYQFWSQKK